MCASVFISPHATHAVCINRSQCKASRAAVDDRRIMQTHLARGKMKIGETQTNVEKKNTNTYTRQYSVCTIFAVKLATTSAQQKRRRDDVDVRVA